MNRILKVASVTRQLRSRGLCHHAGHHEAKYVGTYHSYQEAARAISMNQVARPTMKYTEGYAHYNAKYNKVLGIALAVAAVAAVALLSGGFFRVARHRPMKNTPEGLEFLNHPHEGYHPKLE